ncbi:hypothetical protein [Halobacillus sp. Marseille-Q1614]|uniref:hypothetical protein n=1 Tax=Halobacillus sp. Marseille-Q1614 TaxID=2709134 RepID=UPI00157065C8|nr:hypothetical protein [Halobacillus sp. Marseille-Q1614]
MSKQLSVEQFNENLQQWSGKTIKVTKHEQGDEDTVYIDLNDVSYSRDTRRADEYEPMHELKLNGEGRTETDRGDYQPLPSPVYEIPLEDSTQYQYEDHRFSLITDRGSYMIELEND